MLSLWKYIAKNPSWSSVCLPFPEAWNVSTTFDICEFYIYSLHFRYLITVISSMQVDANVIAVDWSGGGGSWMYWRAVANTRVTGAEVTKWVILKIAQRAQKNILNFIVYKRIRRKIYENYNYIHCETWMWGRFNNKRMMKIA